MKVIDFNQPYDQKAFLDFLQQVFLPEDFSPADEVLDLKLKPRYINEVTHLGECPELGLNVYKIHHGSENDPRVSLTKETFRLMKEYNDFNALAVFISPGSENYRLSYITIGLKPEDTKVTYEYSNPRRYSYFLGPDAKVITPTRFLLKRGRVADMGDLQERFSIEVVNKEFYREIATLFTKLVGGTRKEGSKTKGFESILRLPSVTDHQKMQEFAVRMIGRIVFCWFLKKKTTSDGKPLIPADVLSLEAVKRNDNYYHTFLEKLFFQVLNTPQEMRRKEFQSGPFADIPFLNGGLFEPHADDIYELNEFSGTSKYDNTLVVPDEWLTKLFELLERYNFTIDENTSMDVELSVDPEMLGRIFENLLAEINPETGETARKATGSYYTPRPIVEYMVDESLKQYLLTKTGIQEDKLQRLLSFSQDVEGLSPEERRKIIDALDEVKIIDPACGSGAFPMGILQKMVLVLQKADPDLQIWLTKQLEGIPSSYVRSAVEERMKNEDWNYIRKMDIIQKSIYGVDIQQIAVEISKLRVFLSLVVDSKVIDTKPNKGIESLPNLEFKFVCANTLVGLSKGNGIMFEAHQEIKELKSLRDRYFKSYGDEKQRIEKEFRETQDKMFQHAYQMGVFGGQTLTLSEWDPFSDKSADWFDPEWMFGIKEGFDIAIANPPYRMIQPHNTDRETISFFREEYKLKFKIDLFHLFFKKGIKLLKKSGIFCFIAPSSLLNNVYVESLREWLLKNTSIIKLCITREKFFDHADVHTGVYLMRKGRNFDKSRIKTTFELDKIVSMKNDIYNAVNQDTFLYLPAKTFNLLLNEKNEHLIKRVSSNFQRLGNIADLNRGLITGDKKKYFSERRLSEKHAPILAGKDIKRYYYHEPSQFVLFERPKTAGGCWDEDVHLAPHKILIRQIGKEPTAAFINEKIPFTGNIFSIRTGNMNEEKFILGLINSRFIKYYWEIMFTDFKVSFPQVTIYSLEQIPIPKNYKCEVEGFIDIIDRILSAKEKNPDTDTSQLEKDIDRMVYQLYDLTSEEITIVEGETK